MEKIWGKVTLGEGETAQKILVVFFKKLYPGNTIHVADGIISIEGTFEDTWGEMAEALGSYKNIELNYGVSTAEEGIRKEEKKEEKKEKKEKENKIPIEKKKTKGNEQLRIFAEQSGSFDEFLDKVVNWLRIEKRRQMFVSIVQVAREAQKATWEEIEEMLKQRGIHMSPYDRRDIARAIRQKTGKSLARELLKEVGEYYLFDFSSSSTKQKAVKEKKKPGIFTGISEIEEALQTVQDTWSLPEKVAHILNAIGIKMEDSDKERIIEPMVSALCEDDESIFEDIAALTEFLEEDMGEALWRSSVVNDALKSKGYPAMKITQFIKGLKAVLS